MTVRPIRLLGDPVLRTAAEEVHTFDKELRRLVRDLGQTLDEAEGAGLAAPQIGVSLRVFVYDVDGDVGHLINPVLSYPAEEMQEGEEGCLSIPGLHFPLARRESVLARGVNEYGDPVELTGSRMLARCIQHETDHLDGVLFIDLLDPETRREALRAIREAEWATGSAPAVQLSPHPLYGRAI